MSLAPSIRPAGHLRSVCALTSFRLLRGGLRRRDRYLFAYLVFLAPFTVCPVCAGRQVRYLLLDFGSQPSAKPGFEVSGAGEACRLVLQRYRGLSTIGRWEIYSGIALLPPFR
jgi:hypothetical protein